MGVAVGSVGIPGSTGTFSVSGLSFQPVAVVVFNQFDHLGAHSWTMGCATGSTEQWSVWTGTATETSGYTARKHEGRTDAIAFHRNSVTDAIQWQVAFTSLDSTGFTLDLDVRNNVESGEGANIYYMALGGDHIPEAHAGTFTCGASTGTTAITAPGFRPNSLIVAHNKSGAFDAGILERMMWGVGIAASGNQYAAYAEGKTGTAIDGYHMHRTDGIACSYDGSDAYRSEVQSFDSSGFTINVQDAWTGGDIEHGYLAINAEGAVAGNAVQPTADGNQTYATPGLKPGGVFFCWNGSDSPSTSGSNVEPMRPGVGAMTSTQERHSSGIYRDNAPFGVFTSDGYQIGDEALGFWGVADGIVAGSNSSQASTAYNAFSDDSFTLTWDVIDANNSRAFGWLALPGELTFVPQIYRIVRVPTVVS